MRNYGNPQNIRHTFNYTDILTKPLVEVKVSTNYLKRPNYKVWEGYFKCFYYDCVVKSHT